MTRSRDSLRNIVEVLPELFGTTTRLAPTRCAVCAVVPFEAVRQGRVRLELASYGELGRQDALLQ